MTIKLILLCREGEAREVYLKEAKSIGVEVDVVSTFDELFKKMIDNAYQGIMVDLVTKMKAPKEEKDIDLDALNAFPTAQLKWDRDSGSVCVISLGKTLNSNTLNEFINTECQSFPARSIRLHTRKNVNFNVVLSREEVMGKEFLEHTVTINISKGGCFLFSCQDWSNILHVCFVFNELQDKSPIKGEIRWFVEWGKNMMIPGIGISFNNIKQGQLEEINETFLKISKTSER